MIILSNNIDYVILFFGDSHQSCYLHKDEENATFNNANHDSITLSNKAWFMVHQKIQNTILGNVLL